MSNFPKIAAQTPAWLPDWKRESDYPPHPGTKPRQWAWEFLRRNPDYQANYARLMAQPYYQWLEQVVRTPLGQVFPNWSPDPPHPELYMNEIADKYGFSKGAVFDPADPDAHARPQFSFGWNETEFMARSSLEFVFEGLEKLSSQTDEQSRLILTLSLGSLKARARRDSEDLQREPFVRFDLQRPLTSQLEKAGHLLTWLQKQMEQPLERRKPRRENFRNHLRILDARTSGAAWGNIAEIIDPKIPNEYPDYLVSDRLKKSYPAAQKLRDSDYVFIK